jgi:hypothetical protein
VRGAHNHLQLPAGRQLQQRAHVLRVLCGQPVPAVPDVVEQRVCGAKAGVQPAVAQAAGVPFAGFWLDAPVEVLAQRIAGRRGDPSDADDAVMRAQVARGNEGVGWTRLDAGQGVEALVGEALRFSSRSPYP